MYRSTYRCDTVFEIQLNNKSKNFNNDISQI